MFGESSSNLLVIDLYMIIASSDDPNCHHVRIRQASQYFCNSSSVMARFSSKQHFQTLGKTLCSQNSFWVTLCGMKDHYLPASTRNALTLPMHDIELRGDTVIITAHKGEQATMPAIEFEALLLDRACISVIAMERAIDAAVAAEREACAAICDLSAIANGTMHDQPGCVSLFTAAAIRARALQKQEQT